MENAYRELAALASGHHGLFRTDHLQPCGVTRQQLRSLVDAGWCVRCSRGVYRVLAAPASAEQEILALVWHHPGPSVASDRSAGYLWRLPGFGHHHPEITIAQEVSRRGGRGTTRGTLLLPAHHMTTRWNIPVTTVDRTIFDLAGVERFGRVERAMDTALSRKMCTVASLERTFFLLAGRGRKGTTAMRRLLADRGEGYVAPASELEARARRLFDDAGLPPPEFEVDVGDSDWIGRVDCLWRPARVIVELDGRRYHGGVLARRSDRERDNRLTAQGWRVIRVTWEDIADRPAWVVSLIRQALAAA